MVVISVVSAKGGVGKTTLSACLAMGLAPGRDVLAVDLDPQNALRLHLGVPASEIDGACRATLEERSWQTAVFRGGNGRPSVLPYGNINETDRDQLEAHLSSHPDWLSSGLRSLGLGPQSIVVVDTPPGPSLYQQQALRAANFTLVVIHADAASYATIAAMENILQRYCQGREGFAGSVYLLNSVSAASALSRDVVRVVRADLGDRVIPVVVHQDESVREAMAFDQPVLVYAPHGEATRDIRRVIGWFDTNMPAISSVANAKSA